MLSLIIVVAQLLCPQVGCSVACDINCDNRDDAHCRGGLDLYTNSTVTDYVVNANGTYTLIGECTPDGIEDTFFVFIDGDFDGTATFGDIDDLIGFFPGGGSSMSGISTSPNCDRDFEDTYQQLVLAFSDNDSLVHTRTWPLMQWGGNDFVRGDVRQLAFFQDTVDLGRVECIARDQFDGVTIIDTDVPALGEVYFYVARRVGFSFFPYGYSMCRERIVRHRRDDCDS